MKKYLGIAILIAAILTMGSASAITIQVSSMKLGTSPLITGTLTGPHGGGGGCHNNTNMTELTGVLTYNGTAFTIGTTVLSFGCYNYLNQTSPYDFDGDGNIETRMNELLGLVGTSITVEGYIRCQNTRLIVFYINGVQWRTCSMVSTLL